MGSITCDAFSAVVPTDAKFSARPRRAAEIHSWQNKSREILWAKLLYEIRSRQNIKPGILCRALYIPPAILLEKTN